MIENGDSEPFVLRIHSLFIIHEFLFLEKEIKYTIVMIVLMKENISDIYINVNENIMCY